MASGTIYGKTGNEYIDAKIYWESEPDYEANESEVTAILYYKRNNTGFTTTGTGTFVVSIDGKKVTTTRSITITENGWTIAVSGTVKISHRTDGTRTVTISATGSIPDTTLTSTTVSDTVTLDVIPRETIIDSLSCATRYFSGEMTYKYTPRNSSYYNRCNISLNLNGEYIAVKSINLGQKTTSQQTAKVTFSASELSTIYNALPSDTIKGTLRFTFRTYFDSGYSSQAGSVSYKEISLYIPDISDTKPTATMTLKPVSSLPSPFNTLYIEGMTKVDADFANGDGKYGATIKSYSMSVAGGDYGSPSTSGYLTTSGSVTVEGTVTNSRDFSRKYTQTITVLPYDNPKILPASGESIIICARCDKNGNLTDSGTYLKIKARRSYATVTSDGVQKNFCTLRYRCVPEGTKFTGDEGWVTLLARGTTSTNAVDKVLSGVVSSTVTAYIVQIGVVDDLGMTSFVQFNISTDFVTIDIPEEGKGRRIGIGRYVGDVDEDGIYLGIPIFGGAADIVERGTFDTGIGIWHYKKWSDGTYQMFGYFDVTPTSSTLNSALYRTNSINIPSPFKISSACVTGSVMGDGWISNGGISSEHDNVALRLISDGSLSTTSSTEVRLMVMGKYD